MYFVNLVHSQRQLIRMYLKSPLKNRQDVTERKKSYVLLYVIYLFLMFSNCVHKLFNISTGSKFFTSCRLNKNYIIRKSVKNWVLWPNFHGDVLPNSQQNVLKIIFPARIAIVFHSLSILYYFSLFSLSLFFFSAHTNVFIYRTFFY
jgi:hypothetical protein